MYSGQADISPDGRTMLVSNLAGGWDAYDLPLLQRSQSYRYNLKARFPYDSVFGIRGQLVITGSDGGHVLVFDRKSGKLLQKLTHSPSKCRLYFILFYF